MDRADDKRAPLNFLTFPILPTFLLIQQHQ